MDIENTTLCVGNPLYQLVIGKYAELVAAAIRDEFFNHGFAVFARTLSPGRGID